MQTAADEFQSGLVRLAVDQNEVGLDVAVSVIAALAAEGVIEISPGQRLDRRQYRHGFQRIGVEALAP